MNNSIYDKTMKNLRKRIKIRVVENCRDFIKYTQDLHELIGKYLKTI